MIRTQIYFPKDLYSKVKTEAQKKGVSIAEMVRNAVMEKIGASDSWAKVKPGDWLLKAVKNAERIAKDEKITGPKDVARFHDKYLTDAEIASWKRE